ncbi:disulfide bond formation protein B [Exiguobacterium sp. N5]|nr:disulfide bond formation protein B [Exiguobacterium sp. N5]
MISVISGIAVLGSLFFSEYLKLPPCNLCWYQRIFLYPIPIISIVAYRTNDLLFNFYTGILSFIGLLFAAYHTYIQNNQYNSMFCSISSESCTTIHYELFGFVTIPFLSFITFLSIFLISVLKEREYSY